LGTYGPNGLATDARGNVYLADTGGNRIMVFSPSGALVRTIGAPGSELGQLKQPMGLSFGPDGAMYVTDFENNRIERWDDAPQATNARSEEHTSELQSRGHLVCRLLLEKKKTKKKK